MESVYLMWPGLPADPRVIELIAAHARRVVYLSADVPDLAEGEEPVIYHQEIERLIRRTGLRWTFVRAIDFATNTLAWADQVRAGVVSMPYGRPRGPSSTSATSPTWPCTCSPPPGTTAPATSSPAPSGHARRPGEDHRRGRRPRRPLDELPAETARERLTAAWGDPAFVDARLRAWKSFVDTPERVTDTVERLLGRPARTFRTWARDHADDFR
ncbi:nucleoside-diphosphate sugar epimerase [Actinomadura sp. J1-007]|uniref:nucleoside-diphosphate sugar epimerase n=1 Tax=Actinomadura sp. J1-007 TaxID=2661913 RepID=UPI001F4FD66E|nr:nucleoside-diphosphate sugar epimerase [Actinomadura sp. J1-007]